MKSFISLAITISTALTFVSGNAFSQEVILKSDDGTIQMSGVLDGFDGETYELSTAIGVVRLSASNVTCIGEACPDLVSAVDAFTITGSSTISNELLPILIEAYAFDRGGDFAMDIVGDGISRFSILEADGSVYSTITVISGSSNDAFVALAAGTALIGLSSRPVSSVEQERFFAAGAGDLTSPEQERIIALDGIIAVVHRDNPVRVLSLDQISQVFAGDINNWFQLGGKNAPIVLYRRDENLGVSSDFQNAVMRPLRRAFSQNANVLQSNAAVSDAVGRDVNGIGISSIVDERNARAISLRTVCGQVLAPSDFTIKTEEYPLSRRMYLYTKSGALPDRASELIDFIASSLAQEIVENAGFVGQNVARVSLNQQGRRIANAIVAETDANALGKLQTLLSTVLDAERLSLTFRFISGTSDLDNRAMGDVDRLAAMIRAGDFSNQQILVLGFTDNIGSADENAQLSQSRAEQVREAIIAAVGSRNLGNVKITPVGFGNISPLGCNETEFGRQTNRRVELWVR